MGCSCANVLMAIVCSKSGSMTFILLIFSKVQVIDPVLKKCSINSFIFLIKGCFDNPKALFKVFYWIP